MEPPNNNVYANYLLDLGFLLKEESVEAKQRFLKARGTPNEADATGYLSALHRVVTLMQQQADAFQIQREQLSLHDIHEEFFFNDAKKL